MKSPSRIKRAVSLEHLKRCPLCRAVNAASNPNCFVCGWKGEFEHEAGKVHEGLMEILESCPELLDVFDHEERRIGLFERFANFVRARFRRHRSLDLRA
ncbi:MAG: hypothetical protein JSS72_00405 [Armatimonadetes bacterium]|nr:hypothetical protein [Armatimonadota bacterium]